MGGAARDTLYGGGGSDRFVFNTTLGPANIEQIEDFRHDRDVIALEDFIFKKVGSSLTASELYVKAGATLATTVTIGSSIIPRMAVSSTTPMATRAAAKPQCISLR
jgi:Ca2+-binding RTX toxin-like protein